MTQSSIPQTHDFASPEPHETRLPHPYEDKRAAGLVTRCLAGEEGSWEALIRAYAGLINGVAMRYGLAEQDRADVFQTVCVQLWRSLHQIKDPRRLPAWLVTVAARASWQALHERRGRRESGDAERLLASLPDSSLLPEDQVVMEEQWMTLTAAVQQLASPCRELILALFYDPAQPSYDQIAAQLQVPKNSLGPTRMRCLAKLRQALEREYGDRRTPPSHSLR